jgi:predicted metal-dependent phosphoesterase TrpH
MSIDLHTHSSASDGSESPAEVLASAARAGLDVLALTDHDTTAGWERAATAAMHHGIALVRGIEVSCQHRGVSIHLLGYLQDPASPGLLAELDRSKMSRETRARRIVGLLSRDLPLDWDDVLAHVEPGATIGRPHIAAAMLDKHIVTSIASAFDSYLKDGSPYYVAHYAPDPVTAVRLVGSPSWLTLLRRAGEPSWMTRSSRRWRRRGWQGWRCTTRITAVTRYATGPILPRRSACSSRAPRTTTVIASRTGWAREQLIPLSCSRSRIWQRV